LSFTYEKIIIIFFLFSIFFFYFVSIDSCILFFFFAHWYFREKAWEKRQMNNIRTLFRTRRLASTMCETSLNYKLNVIFSFTFEMIRFWIQMNSLNNKDVGLENHNIIIATSTRQLHDEHCLAESNYTECETIKIFKK
jgi:hypothetical protein